MGGQTGFGPIPVGPDEPGFHADWEARVAALSTALMRNGTLGGDEFRDAIERLPPADYLAASYYERWLAALELLLAEKKLLAPGAPVAPGGTVAASGTAAADGPVASD
jgi:nitrile hydratase subunit beta